MKTIDIVFDGPPSHQSGRFVEVERDDKSVKFGEWVQRDDGYWVLRITDPEPLVELINKPELDHFLRGVHVEAVHQVERWGEANDRAKRPADWFWLVGYLAGKALHAALAGDLGKAKHHCISTAAALYNWHCSIAGIDVRMAPGRSDIAEIVDAAFPGEAA